MIPKEPSNEKPAAHGWVLPGRSSSSTALAAHDHRPQGRSTSQRSVWWTREKSKAIKGYAEKPNLGEERDILDDLGQPVPRP